MTKKNDPIIMGYKGIQSLDQLKDLRREVYDRWCWETGSEEDEMTLKELDKMIENWNDSATIYCPFIPLEIFEEVGDDDY